jgi:hypothetical protein
MEKQEKNFDNSEDYFDMYEVFQDNDKNISKYMNSLLRENIQESSQLSEVRKAENQLKYSNQAELYDLLFNFLDSHNIEIRRVAVKNISKVNSEKRFILQQKADRIIEQTINFDDIQISRIGMNLIDYASDELRGRLINASYNQIANGLNSGDILKQKILAKKIHILPEEKRAEQFTVLYSEMLKWLKTGDVFAVRSVAQMVRYLPVEMQIEIKKSICEFYEANKNNPELIKSSVYSGVDFANVSNQTRGTFSKTGSGITLLLAEKLRYQVLVRTVEESCFLEWKRAYEASGFWKSMGFDYVPVEPIISYSKKKDGTMNCTAGMLDLNYDEWLSISGDCFQYELEVQKKKINDGLKLLNIKHGHLNNDNYCLKFYRDREGVPDFSKIPKIMVIDFDQAYRTEVV